MTHDMVDGDASFYIDTVVEVPGSSPVPVGALLGHLVFAQIQTFGKS